MDRLTFLKGMGLLKIAFPRKFDESESSEDLEDAEIELYWKMLHEEIRDLEWEQVVTRCVKNLRFFPKISEILSERDSGRQDHGRSIPSPRTNTGPIATKEEIREIRTDPKYRQKAIDFLDSREPARLGNETDEEYSKACLMEKEFKEKALADMSKPGFVVPIPGICDDDDERGVPVES